MHGKTADRSMSAGGWSDSAAVRGLIGVTSPLRLSGSPIRRVGGRTMTSVGGGMLALLICLVQVYAFSGNPGLETPENGRIVIAGWAIILIFLMLVRGKLAPSPASVLIMCGFLGLLMVQCYINDYFPMITILGFMTRLIAAYGIVKLVQPLHSSYVRVLAGTVMLSLPVYVLNYASDGSFGERITSIIPPLYPSGHYLFNLNELDRSAAYFWEPGAFAGYLVVALLFLAIYSHRLSLAKHRALLLILALGILTTKSTTGYICLMVVLTMHSRAFVRKGLTAAAVTLVAVVVLAMWMKDLDFISSKLEGQYTQAMRREANWRSTRFGSAMADWEYISRRPLVGWGLHSDTRFSLIQDEFTNVQGNGLTDFAAKFGIPGLAVFLGCTYVFLYRVSSGDWLRAALGTLVIAIVLNGECFLNYPLFLGFFFAPWELPREGRAVQRRAYWSRLPTTRVGAATEYPGRAQVTS